MALEYILHLKTENSLQEVANEWFAHEDYNLEFSESGKENVIFANYPYFQITFLKYDKNEKRPIVIFGFTPTISVSFRLLPNGEKHELARETLARTGVEWLQNTQDLLCILFNGEQGMIMRSSEGIFIDPRHFPQKKEDNLPFDYLEEVFNV